MNRRSFIASILAAGVAPYVAKAGVLMPVRRVWVPEVTGMSLMTGAAPSRANVFMNGVTLTDCAWFDAVNQLEYSPEILRFLNPATAKGSPAP